MTSSHLFHLQSLGRFVVVDTPTVEEEPQTRHWDADTLGVGLFQLSHLRRHFDSEVNFVGVLTDDLRENRKELLIFRETVITKPGIFKNYEPHSTMVRSFVKANF